jgi:hypothetical protein
LGIPNAAVVVSTVGEAKTPLLAAGVIADVDVTHR